MVNITENKADLIVRNVVKACADIEKLNSTGYKYLYLCSGFIAHYNIYGFKDYYRSHDLEKDLLNNQRLNQWNNFSEGDKDYQYYKSKATIYNRVLLVIENKHLNLYNT
jgi:hypothetical protein